MQASIIDFYRTYTLIYPHKKWGVVYPDQTYVKVGAHILLYILINELRYQIYIGRSIYKYIPDIYRSIN